MKNSRWTILSLFIGVAVLSRWLPHPMNFSPVAAIALFGGHYFNDKKWAFGLPMAIMLLSDLVLGFHGTIWAVYLSFALVALIGWMAKARLAGQRPGVGTLAIMGIGSSLLFFVTTNFAVWAQTGLYPMTFDGLVACYVAALPFFQNSLAGNLVYMTVLFGGFALVDRKWLSQVPA